MIDNRLKKCCEFVSGRGVVCDVGTDHAYLAAELVLSGKCNKVIASDIKSGPLEAARKTVEKYALSDKIELVLSDGLENIDGLGVSDIVIAGMGGETIIKILEDCDWVRNHKVKLILQPMTKADVLRKWLGAHGFKSGDHAVEEGENVYIVITAVYDGVKTAVSEFKSLRGNVDHNTPAGRKYIRKLSDSLNKKADSLEGAGMSELARHERFLADNLHLDSIDYPTADEIYRFLDSRYPFELQEGWDNSGFLVESASGEKVSRILLTLDIDMAAAKEAADCEAQLIISHHPLIFEPIKKIEYGSPLYFLVENSIGAICMHTNLDIADGGTNGTILKKISERFKLAAEPKYFEDCGGGNGLGYVCTLSEPVSAEEFGEELKKIFGCEYVRMNRHNCGIVKMFAFCSGSGGSMLGHAHEIGCDAYITGDVKHDVWIDANNNNIVLYDCGHFHTENLVLAELRRALLEKFPQLEIIIAESSEDPCVFIKQVTK